MYKPCLQYLILYPVKVVCSDVNGFLNLRNVELIKRHNVTTLCIHLCVGWIWKKAYSNAIVDTFVCLAKCVESISVFKQGEK